MDLFDKLLSGKSAGDMLDVATDTGDFITTLTEIFKDYDKIIGTDISDSGFKEAREIFKNKPIEFIQMDGAALKFDDSSFDTVTVCAGLHHMDNIPAVLSEMYRVLKPGGVLRIAVNNDVIAPPDDRFEDSFVILSDGNQVITDGTTAGVPGPFIMRLGFILKDPTATALSSDALVAPVLADFSERTNMIVLGCTTPGAGGSCFGPDVEGQFRIDAEILSIVEEPPELSDIAYPRQPDGTRLAKGVVSRKKQLLPTVLGLLER